MIQIRQNDHHKTSRPKDMCIAGFLHTLVSSSPFISHTSLYHIMCSPFFFSRYHHATSTTIFAWRKLLFIVDRRFLELLCPCRVLSSLVSLHTLHYSFMYLHCLCCLYFGGVNKTQKPRFVVLVFFPAFFLCSSLSLLSISLPHTLFLQSLFFFFKKTKTSSTWA